MYTVYDVVWMAEYSELIERSEGPILYIYVYHVRRRLIIYIQNKLILPKIVPNMLLASEDIKQKQNERTSIDWRSTANWAPI